MAGSRASRVQRPPTPPAVQLTVRDLDLLDSLGRVRFLTADLVEWLHYPPQAGPRARGFSSSCRTRLRVLWQAGYLERLWLDRFHGAPVYALGPRGVAALGAHRARAPATLARPGRDAPSTLFLAHALGIARVYAAIGAALRAVSAVHPVDFQGEHAFKGPGDHDQLPDPADGRRLIPVVPDGLCQFARADGRRWLVFLEVDRATMSLPHIAAKVRGYESYRLGPGPALFQARFGYPPEFSVALVAATAARRQALQQTVLGELTRWGWASRAGRYLFHTLAGLTPATALTWTDAQGQAAALLGPAPHNSAR